MKKQIIKLLILIVILVLSGVPATNSFFTDHTTVTGFNISLGCWAAPSVPQLVYPNDGYNAVPGSDWLANPYMDWENSISTCPLATTITYQYESYKDAGLTQIAYQSIWLSNSQIPAPGTPDGTYYWHVRARDQFGNTSDFSAPWLLTVDRSEPAPTSTPTETPSPTGGVVINEVYYDVASGQNEGNTSNPDEWVELYNSGDTAVNLKDWTLADNHDSTKINRNVEIPAKGFAVLAKNADAFMPWSIPSEAIKIELGQRIGDGLANSSDRVILRDNNDHEMDAVSWGNDSYAFGADNGIMPLTGDGKSIARVTKGVDTDSPSDWHVLDTPNPGTNPHPPETGPTVDFSLRSDKHAVSFQVSNIKKFKTISYEITYDAQPEAKQIAGTADLGSEDSFIRENLLLGTCSSIEGKVCVYDWGMTKITLRVVLTLPNGETAEIIKEIAY